MASIQYSAEAVIGIGEKGYFHLARLIFEGEKLHGFDVLGVNHLVGDQ